jgi:hypothetical protein
MSLNNLKMAVMILLNGVVSYDSRYDEFFVWKTLCLSVLAIQWRFGFSVLAIRFAAWFLVFWLQILEKGLSG